jgi:hypothetical protein
MTLSTGLGLGLLLPATLMAAACSSRNGDTTLGAIGSSSPSAKSTSTAVTIRFEARVDANNDLMFRTIPNATCLFRWADHEPDSGPAPFDVSSDSEGMVAFSARVAGVETARAAVACQDGNGVSAKYTLEIQGSVDVPAASMHAEYVQQKQGPVRPSLAEEVASQMSDEEIVAAHYPPRPDRATSADAYSLWLERVSHPAALWTGPRVAESRRRYTGIDVSNWSGITTHQPSTQKFESIEGQWVVPNVNQNVNFLESSTGYADSAIWVGLSNSNPPPGVDLDLYQGGTDESVTCTYIVGDPGHDGWYCLQASRAFYEPNIGGYDFNLPGWTAPGDTFYAELWAGNSSGVAEYDGSYLWFYFQNYNPTTKQYTYDEGDYLTTPLAYANFNYSNWIVERPVNFYSNGQAYLPHLADVGTESFSAVNSSVKSGTWIPFESLPYDTYSMYDAESTRLAYPVAKSSTTFNVVWTAYGTEDPAP